MNIHEYQAKELLAKFGVPVPAGIAALTVEEAVAAAKAASRTALCREVADPRGRPRQGQVQGTRPRCQGRRAPCPSRSRKSKPTPEMLGNTLVTIQTGDAGKQVNRLYITDGVDIGKEYYLSMLVDRKTGRIAMIASTEGGMDIEDVAHDTPEKIVTITIDPAPAFSRTMAARLPSRSSLTGDLNKQAQKLAQAALRRLRGARLLDDRDQPAGRKRR
jgi:succinyl-CoA synthetase beta subunit